MRLLELNRKMNIYTWITLLVFIIIVSGIFLTVYIKRDTVYYVRYNEKSDLDYKVALKKNEFFDDKYLKKDNQYISSLIDFIKADFKYDLNVQEDLEYNYKYKIIANVNVIDNTTNKAIYTFSEDILEEITGQSNNDLNIDQNVKIDYNKYNDLISEFVKVYNLKNVTSKLNVNMYVEIAGTVEEFAKVEESVISLEIPLTTNTVGIDMNYDLANNVDKLITLKPSYKKSEVFLLVSIILFVIDIGLLIGLLIYIKKSETEEEKYNVQLKRILNNYGSYISKIEDEFDMKDYQILKVENFVDLLEIRDTMHIPIIMIENKENMNACFIIATNNNILYFYSLGVTQYALPVGKENEEKLRESDVGKKV